MTQRTFTMRQFLGFIGIVAVLTALLRLGWVNTSHRTYSVLVVVVPALLMYCCFTVSNHIRSFLAPDWKTSFIVKSILFIVLAVNMYVLWARFRILSYCFAFDERYPREFPYPDQLLEEYHHYLDVTNPVEPGFIKIHAEYPRLHRHLDVVAVLMIATTAAVAGLVIPNLSWHAIRSILTGLCWWCRGTKAHTQSSDADHIDAHQ